MKLPDKVTHVVEEQVLEDDVERVVRVDLHLDGAEPKPGGPVMNIPTFQFAKFFK